MKHHCNVPQPWGGGHIDYVVDPIGIGVGMTLSCPHNILWTSCWSLTKLLWLYNWDITKNWLDFGDIDLIFKVTAVEKLRIHGWGTSVFSENTITSCFIPHHIKVVGYYVSPWNVCLSICQHLVYTSLTWMVFDGFIPTWHTCDGFLFQFGIHMDIRGE